MTSPVAQRLRLCMDMPLRVAAGTLVVRGTPRLREAVHIRLRDDIGTVGHGEAMPLPGFSVDDAEAAWRVLAAVAERVARSGLCVAGPGFDAAAHSAAGARPGRHTADRLDAALAAHDDLLAASVSARFALECALVDLLARRAGLGAAQWLAGDRALQPVPVSLLLPDDDRSVVDAATAAVAAGFTVLKLKIARSDRSEHDEDALLDTLRGAIDGAAPGAVRLRLDANGALAPSQAARRLAALSRHAIELVEEPVAGAALLDMPPLPLPWAADESLADPVLTEHLLALPPGRRPTALVLKPALLGLARCLRLADAAAARGIGLIVTHSLDGDLGHAAACALAAALPQPPWPCGLAPHAGLRRPPPARPWLAPPSAPGLGVDDTGSPA